VSCYYDLLRWDPCFLLFNLMYSSDERANLPTVPTKNENGTRTAIGGGEFQSQRGSRIALST
jgi:hypothetical protein